MNDIVNELKDIDVQIKRGNFTSASSMLRKLYRRLSTSGEMKAHINELCQLAWRINRPQWILRWLKPSISDKDLSLTRSVPPDLILIYAAALIDIGIFHQAEKLLDLDSVKNIPQANQYRAMAHIRRWNYDLAIPCLRAYMDSLPQEHYSRRVAQVNLAESYICENKLDEAENVLVDLNHYIKESQNRLFSNTTKKLWLRFFIEKKNWQSAKSIIEETSSFLSHQKSFERTFMKKWHIILKMYEKGLDEALKAEFDDIRREAVHSLHWETLRDIDWQICKWNPDPEILNRLWYGTDYPHYRKQIEERFHFQPSQELVFNLKLLNPFQVNYYKSQGTHSNHQHCELYPVFDINLISKSKKNSELLKPNGLLHLAMKALLSDFYKPLSLTGLFNKLYPDNYWNPVSSPKNVHHVLFELRSFLKENKFPFEVCESRGYYFLKANHRLQVGMHMTSEQKLSLANPLDWSEQLDFYSQILEKNGMKPNTKNLATLLKVSTRTLKRYRAK